MTQSTESIDSTVADFLASRASPAHGASVVFNDISVEGWGRGVQEAPTVFSAVRSWIEMLNPTSYLKKYQPWRILLHSFSGTVTGGEMLFVIGKPGSGYTTFLKTLANMRSEYKNTNGDLLYGNQKAFTSPARRTFCAEEDAHLPTLTVEETLRFAVRSTWDAKASQNTIDTAVHTLAKSIGLGHVLHTKVGDATIRGVSGGELRRVSLAEAMATCPEILCLDNPTNGLDSSTALEFIQMARAFTTQHGCATTMSIYQGSNAMVPLFDKVLVIHSGRQIFYGPASEAQSYFEELGFICPDRATVTDFLNSMTAEPQLRHVRPGFEFSVPKTAEQFEEAFRSSHYYQHLKERIAAMSATDPETDIHTPTYSLPIYQQVSQCTVRQMRVLVRDYKTWGLDAACMIVQSILCGTIFRNEPQVTQSFFMLASSMFITILIPALQSINEFGNTFAQRPLVIRQKEYRFYRPLSYALALVMTDIPWKVFVVGYNIPQYFMTGFQMSGGKFFTWFCVAYVQHMALSMIFRAISVFSPSMVKATLPVGFVLSTAIYYTGLYIPPRQMQVWLSWFRYLNPIYYAYESAMSNEFGNLNYTCSTTDLVPNGSGYTDIANQVCAVSGSVSGQSVVAGKSYIREQYGFEVSHLWRNVGINTGFFVAFSILTAIGMERYKVPAGRLATIFYKANRKDFALSHSSGGSNYDSEKGQSPGDDVVPGTSTALKHEQSHSMAVHHGRTLVWKNVILDIKTSDGSRRLLDNINGSIRPGELTALMGMSGAGKSTLLNALAGRIEFGKLLGDLYLDGSPLPKSFRRTMGYVQQQDIHLPTQTVREALQMTARLRRPENISLAEKDAYVEDVIRILEMEDIADALIGVPGAGMNLEQRKRVTIGVELSAMPDVLFLDEPTSGLDGQSAIKIVRLLKKLAASGQTVLCTIHQPASEVIETFDNLILLVRGGKLAYAGPFGSQCSTAISYFSQRGRAFKENENPAEFLLEVVGAGSRNASMQNWAELWNSSEEKERLQIQLDADDADREKKRMPSSTEPKEATFATSFYLQLLVVVKRTWLFYWRSPDYFTAKLAMNVGQALVNGLSYLNSSNSEQGAYNRVFSIFVSLIVGPPLGLMVIPRFTTLRDLFMNREKASHTYHWLAFVVAVIAVELPYAVVTSSVYWLLWYFPAGFMRTPTRAGYSYLLYELFSVFMHSLAHLCASLMPTLGGAFTANGFFFMFINTFAGALIPRPLTHQGWKWYYYVSPLYYYSEGTVSSALEGLQIKCREDELSVFQPPTGQTCASYAADFFRNATGYLMDSTATTDCQYCRYKDGQSYYTQYDYSFDNRYRDIGIFIGFIAFNYTAVLVVTYLRVRK